MWASLNILVIGDERRIRSGVLLGGDFGQLRAYRTESLLVGCGGNGGGVGAVQYGESSVIN